MAMWYWSVAILFWQLSIDHIVNGQCKRCRFAKTLLRHPSLPFDSLPYPTRTICRRVRTYARSVTWQPKENRLTIFYEYGALSHARFAREGAPLLKRKKLHDACISEHMTIFDRKFYFLITIEDVHFAGLSEYNIFFYLLKLDTYVTAQIVAKYVHLMFQKRKQPLKPI